MSQDGSPSFPQTLTMSSADMTVAPTPASLKSAATTVMNLDAVCDKLKKDELEADAVASVPQLSVVDAEAQMTPTPRLSQSRKWVLLSIFCLALFIDVLSVSAFFVLSDIIATDFSVPFQQASWIITSYSITFAAFLLFWGRVSDLYSAKPVFVYGMAALGALFLVTSFVPEKLSFFIFRALSGIAGAALVPSSYRLITEVFEPHELGKAFTLFGIAGAVGNVIGVLIAGVFALISLPGQGANWRWFFRFLTVLLLPAAATTFALIPRGSDTDAASAPASDDTPVTTSKLQRLDLVGVVTMLAAIMLLVVGLTNGADHGWKTPQALVPFLLSLVVLFPGFFFWESRLAPDVALLPSSFWKVPNVAVIVVFALSVNAWWGVNFIAHISTYMAALHEGAIHAAVRMLPQGIAAFAMMMLLIVFPRLVARPYYTMVVGFLGGIVGYVLFLQATTYTGADYWRWIFTGSVIGSFFEASVFTSANVALMTSVDKNHAGVAGAVLQVAFQVGMSVALGAQAGLLKINPGGIANPDNVHASLYFQLGWQILSFLLVAFCYRTPKDAGGEDDKAPVVSH